MASHKRAPGSRPAVDRGIPVHVVDAIIAVLGVDEVEITADATLAEDLGASDLDLVEIGEQLGIEDRCLDWLTVKDVMADTKAV
jgi:acyl carrier protein